MCANVVSISLTQAKDLKKIRGVKVGRNAHPKVVLLHLGGTNWPCQDSSGQLGSTTQQVSWCPIQVKRYKDTLSSYSTPAGREDRCYRSER